MALTLGRTQAGAAPVVWRGVLAFADAMVEAASPDAAVLGSTAGAAAGALRSDAESKVAAAGGDGRLVDSAEGLRAAGRGVAALLWTAVTTAPELSAVLLQAASRTVVPLKPLVCIVEHIAETHAAHDRDLAGLAQHLSVPEMGESEFMANCAGQGAVVTLAFVALKKSRAAGNNRLALVGQVSWGGVGRSGAEWGGVGRSGAQRNGASWRRASSSGRGARSWSRTWSGGAGLWLTAIDRWPTLVSRWSRSRPGCSQGRCG